MRQSRAGTRAEGPARSGIVDHPHTRRHLPDLWIPSTFRSGALGDREAAGDARQRARELVRQIRAEHHPEPLPDDLDRELLAMIKARTAEG